MSTIIPKSYLFTNRQFMNTGAGGEDIAVMIETGLVSDPVEIPTQNESNMNYSTRFPAIQKLLPLALIQQTHPLPEQLRAELCAISS